MATSLPPSSRSFCDEIPSEVRAPTMEQVEMNEASSLSCLNSYAAEMFESSFEYYTETTYNRMCGLILEDAELRERGFPKNASVPGIVYVKPTNTPWTRSSLSENKRQCCRCKTPYDKSSPQGPCTYHWGKVRKNRRGCLGYTCCSSPKKSVGCTTAPCHVSIIKKEEFLIDFIVSQPCDYNEPGLKRDIVALDCEMCFTDEGLEVTRVMLMDWTAEVLLYVIVVPERPIVDYNTRFSGLTEEHFKGPTMTLECAREEVLRYVKEDTIVLGHGLENDLIGLRIEHRKVIDTSVLFPHRAGFPLRRSLRDLTFEFLNRIFLFDGDLYGTLGDARVCLELVLMMVRNDGAGNAS